MGYTFKIGNAEPYHDKADFPYLEASWAVKGEHHENAPAFGEPTDYTNSRWPSYSAWSEFCHKTGLREFFYDDFGHLHAGHPGCIGITQEDADMVTHKLKWYRENNAPIDGEEDFHLNRLIWLEYWMQWAVKNCETPAIENT